MPPSPGLAWERTAGPGSAGQGPRGRTDRPSVQSLSSPYDVAEPMANVYLNTVYLIQFISQSAHPPLFHDESAAVVQTDARGGAPYIDRDSGPRYPQSAPENQIARMLYRAGSRGPRETRRDRPSPLCSLCLYLSFSHPNTPPASSLAVTNNTARQRHPVWPPELLRWPANVRCEVLPCPWV